MPRRIGLDVHREFAQIAVWEDGIVRQAGQVATTPEGMRAFAESLLPTDEVAIEATCNTHAIAKLIAPRVARVVISNPMKTRDRRGKGQDRHRAAMAGSPASTGLRSGVDHAHAEA